MSLSWVRDQADRIGMTFGSERAHNSARRLRALLQAREEYLQAHGSYPTQVGLAKRLGLTQAAVSARLRSAGVTSPAHHGGRPSKGPGGTALTRPRALALQALLRETQRDRLSPQARSALAFIKRLAARKLSSNSSVDMLSTMGNGAQK
jgi:hypothetical protein